MNYMQFKKLLIAGLIAFTALTPTSAFAQEVVQPVEQQYLAKARVIEATPSVEKVVEGTSVVTETQQLTVRVLEGAA